MVYLECNPDEVLAKTLGFSRRQIVHAAGKGDICNKLAKTKGALALVDEDPQSAQPSYIKGLKFQGEKNELKIWQDFQRSNFLLMLCPRLEEWIVKTAGEEKLNLAKYKLPGSPKKLHGVINLESGKFEKFLIEALPTSARLKTLRNFLKKYHSLALKG